jgi:dihydroorotase
MNILIQNGRVIDPASGLDQQADVAIADGRVASIGAAPAGFVAHKTIDARSQIVVPGLIDLSARLREPGHEHEGMLASELAAAVAGGVTMLVPPPDTDPVLDEPGLVEMLTHRTQRLQLARVAPLGALTRGLAGEVLTELSELSDAGCVAFGQADVALEDTQVLLRALQYAATFGHIVCLRPNDAFLGRGVAASGALATRLGLSGVPVIAETIALHTIIELVRATSARVHIARLSSAAGVELLRAAKATGLPITADVSVHNLHLTDTDIGYFDSRLRLSPPVRQQRDRDALRAALADGTIDVLVSDHTPVDEDEKALPFGEAEPGASSVEMLLSLALKWAADSKLPLPQALARVTSAPARVLLAGAGNARLAQTAGMGAIKLGGVADVCVFDPAASWTVSAESLRSQSKLSPFAFELNGTELPGRVTHTLVGGRLAFVDAVSAA